MNEMELLRRSIWEAFADTSRPEKEQIAPHQCEECDQIRSDFALRRVDEIPAEMLRDHYGSLPLLGPAALAYFLPAYLSYSLDHSDSEVFEFTIYHLTPSNKDIAELGDYWPKRLEEFTTPQRQVILRFIEWAKEVADGDFYEGEFSRGLRLWGTA